MMFIVRMDLLLIMPPEAAVMFEHKRLQINCISGLLRRSYLLALLSYAERVSGVETFPIVDQTIFV